MARVRDRRSSRRLGRVMTLSWVDRQARVDRGGRVHDRADGTGWGGTTVAGRVRRALQQTAWSHLVIEDVNPWMRSVARAWFISVSEQKQNISRAHE